MEMYYTGFTYFVSTQWDSSVTGRIKQGSNAVFWYASTAWSPLIITVDP
jgi:hypothetical protein